MFNPKIWLFFRIIIQKYGNIFGLGTQEHSFWFRQFLKIALQVADITLGAKRKNLKGKINKPEQGKRTTLSFVI